jgi:signal transduction histidine kinase
MTTTFTQILIGLLLLSLLSIFRLPKADDQPGDQKLIRRLKYIIGISAVWMITAFIASFETSIDKSNFLVFVSTNKAFNLLGVLFALSSYFFIKIFPTYKKFSRSFKLFEKILIGTLLVSIPVILFSNLATGSYLEIPANSINNYVRINENYSYRSGELAIPFGFLLIFTMGVAIHIGLSRKFNKRASEIERAQSKTIVLGIALSIFLGALLSLILPSVIINYPNTLYVLGQIAPIAMTFSATSAVLKYRLFDIKSSVFRAVGYSLSIATLAAFEIFVVWGIILPIIYPGTPFTVSSLLLVIGATVLTIYFYNRIKSIFDTLTDKLFFKNTYNLTQFLDEFNQALINSSDINELSSAIMKVISENLKSEFIILMIKSGDFEIVVDSRKRKVSTIDKSLPAEMIKYYYTTGIRVVLRDYIEDQESRELSIRLSKVAAAAAIDLSESSKTVTPLKTALESGNYKTMILGPKKSGQNYTIKDLDTLKIISTELVVGLQNSMRFEEIKQFNLDLQSKVDSATHRLSDQNKKLVVADELKDDFLSIASHQMRTPISAILGYASILNSGDAGKMNKEQEKFAKTVEGSAKRLSYLINDFLTVSRLKSGKFNIEKVKTDLKKTIRAEIKSLENQFASKEIELKINIDAHIPIFRADEQKLRQVMMNMIDNAMYYTPQGGEVEVTLKLGDRGLIFEVRDSGIGVPKEDQSMLFTRMFRASNAQKMRPDGTGLGLYLAKKVVLGHGGHIIFRSKEGEGSTFGFTIPTK